MPNLHDVVLGHRADDPRFIGVPGEIGDLGCVASMDELTGTKMEDETCTAFRDKALWVLYSSDGSMTLER